MERIKALIEKLHQQQLQNVSAEQLLITVQILQLELLQLQKGKITLGTAKVAVTLPSTSFARSVSAETFGRERNAEVVPQKPAVLQETAEPFFASESKKVEEPQPAFAPQPVHFEEQREPYILRRPQIIEPPKKENTPFAAAPNPYMPFEMAEEIPTLAPQPSKKEVHETIANHAPSLNDRLKEEKVEIAHRLKETPIKDLRKAIGINDRFTFINELFKGDEAGYERSVKTINNFNIFSEAEFWMRRELRLKLAWSDDHPTVQHFYELVRRRFS